MACLSAKLLACAVVAAAPLTASAALFIDAGPGATTLTFSTGNYVAGTEFTLSSPMTVRSLGWLDLEGDGLTVSHQIGLWDVATQTLLTTATVNPGNPTIPSAHAPSQWVMVGIPDLVLPAGTYRIAGEVNGDNIALLNDRIAPAGVTLTNGYVRTDFPNGGFAYPNLTFASSAVRVTLSDQVIPAPASFLALAGLLPLARRRRA